MEIKILQVFLGADGLPYKDQERTVHFPIVGSGFQGASNTTKIRFYYDELIGQDDTETSWVACAKLPNGKIGSKVLETDYDSTLGEHYALLELDSFYFQYKGDVYISLQGYQGGVQVDYDEETELYTISGTPTIAATGSIKLSVNYATQFVGSGETSNVNFQLILADLGTKLGIRATSVFVEELPTVGNPDTFYVIHNDLSDPNKANIYIWNSVTEHYIWVGDNSLYLGEYYTKDQVDNIENGLNERIGDIETEISTLGSGSPKGTYATLADLETAYPTGTTGIFVVLADGHWYYWNGSAWTDGGVYLSTANAVPTSRTIAGIVLSSDISKSALESALKYVEYKTKEVDYTQDVEEQISFPNTGLLSNTTGQINAIETAYKTTDYIDLTNVTGIYRTGTTVMFTLWRYAFYDENYNFLGIVADTTNYTIVTHDGKQVTWLDLTQYPTAKYIRISWDISRPYTYWDIRSTTFYKYDLPSITINGAKPLKLAGKKIVNFGDSIFGNYRDTNNSTDKSISKMIADSTGAVVYNAGFGGCRMSYASQYWRAFSMYALADAITTGVWTDQDAAIAAAPQGMPSYFSETLAMLKAIDFDEIDYITIGYGTNDYTGDIFIDYRSGLEEYQYFKGAIEYSVRKILQEYPHIRIAIISPCWRWFLSNGTYSYSSDDEQSKNGRDLMLTDYVDACKEMCNKLHVAYIDTYYTLGYNQYSYSYYFPSNDGTHPNQAGRQLRADRIVGEMEKLF